MIHKLMVVGAGQMGSGIAQVAAEAGYEVWLYDVNEAMLEKGISKIEQNLTRDVQKERKTAERKEEILRLITKTNRLEDAKQADLVIEAVVENLEVKTSLFQQLDSICPPETIFASNTSSLSITKLASCTNRAPKFIGLHFFNPVPVMKLVEIIPGVNTAEETLSIAYEVAGRMNKEAFKVNDFPGFVANRLLIPMINEAIYCVYEGVAEPEAIDNIMKLGANHPIGPLALADLIGLDTVLSIMEVLHEGFGDSKYRPCPLLRQYVQAGRLGRKTGQGFYTY